MQQMSKKHILIRDMERNPYFPKDPEYEDWVRKDDERLQKISDYREWLKGVANQLMSHEDKGIRELAKFMHWFFRD